MTTTSRCTTAAPCGIQEGLHGAAPVDIATSFLFDIWGDAQGDASISYGDGNIWENKWVVAQNPQERARKAAEMAVKLSNNGYNAYYGVCLGDKAKANKRLSNKAVTAMTCFQMDIDQDVEGHHASNSNCSPIKDWEVNVFSELPPTKLVKTGGGHHAYWSFKEPIYLETDEQRQKILLVQKMFQKVLAEKAGGYSVDGTGDLARVLRVPGTKNYKNPKDIKTVEIVDTNTRKYTLDELKEFIGYTEPKPEQEPKKPTGANYSSTGSSNPWEYVLTKKKNNPADLEKLQSMFDGTYTPPAGKDQTGSGILKTFINMVYPLSDLNKADTFTIVESSPYLWGIAEGHAKDSRTAEEYIIAEIEETARTNKYNPPDEFKTIEEPVKEPKIIDTKPITPEEYITNHSVISLLDNFWQVSKEQATIYPTGLRDLDNLLDGGFYGGALYTLGATTGLGKTTLVLQAADNIARNGQDVIIFSLEMSKHELMAKSLSRLSYILYGKDSEALTTREILRGGLDNAKSVILREALNEYRRIAKHLFIHEGMGDIGVLGIRKAVEKHCKITGRCPAVIVDYIQILAPYDPRSSDKQNTDKAVLELKRLARDLNCPVIGISSFNRDNYTAPVNLAAFKESGALEYGSDVVIGLQPEYLAFVAGETVQQRKNRIQRSQKENEARQRNGEDIEVDCRILKNRSGVRGRADLLVNLRYNTYTDMLERIFSTDDFDEVPLLL